ncbi:GreA/GreB family elongation factor [uncultured Mycolicibacterium sp.]|uniref:GreA/GreB family elongation factor n=1 Tax=uncultured Mycolicibacterium sp. TaxID=2320817 RepID=UPI00263718BC|nr:GreA/GreB family elongation factor [uncultured Mycolicibacterium sp.]
MGSQRIWLTPDGYRRLQEELETLKQLCRSTPDDEVDETDENVIAIQRARHARIQQIHEMLINAVVGETPPNDGVAEPGMVLTIRYDDGETERFLLGARGAEMGDIEVYSADSPLGAAILGARVGETRHYQVPSGDTVAVTLLEAVPYGMHQAAG